MDMDLQLGRDDNVQIERADCKCIPAATFRSNCGVLALRMLPNHLGVIRVAPLSTLWTTATSCPEASMCAEQLRLESFAAVDHRHRRGVTRVVISRIPWASPLVQL